MKTKPKPALDKYDIKAALHRQGMTLTKLAELNNLNPNQFRAVWSRTHRKAEAAIATFLGVPAAELFPDRYPVRTSRILSSKYDADSTSEKSASSRNAA